MYIIISYTSCTQSLKYPLYPFSSAIDLLAVLDVRVPQCLEAVPMFGKILEAVQQKVYNFSELFLVLEYTVYKSICNYFLYLGITN